MSAAVNGAVSRAIAVTVNGSAFARTVPLRLLLVDFIRDACGLTGTRSACAHDGSCGACTVHIDGRAIKSCMVLAVQADGRAVTTVEGLGTNGKAHRLQRAFRDYHAVQCGYCTSGMLMTAAEFLEDNTNPSEAEVRQALAGNLCRCGAYGHIVEAVLAAAAWRHGLKPPPPKALAGGGSD